jgi:Fumarylacetoacetate (FAA) hydrolase family
MRLVTYRDRDRNIKPGVLLDEEIVDISDQVANIRSLIEEGPDALGRLRKFLQGTTHRIPLARVELQAPLQNPPRIFCVGLGGARLRLHDHERCKCARRAKMATSQWSLGKSFDTFGPLGPVIVTKDEVPDPHALDIKLTIGGEVLQSSNTRELIFRVPDLIAHLSAITTLEAGDIISTGTPAGVGLGRTPHRWLRPRGDDSSQRWRASGSSLTP